MSHTLGKIFVVTLLLITFIGQSFASSSMPCEMPENTHAMHMSMKDMSDIDHTMMASDSMAEDCCSVDCSCPTSVCASVLLVPMNYNTLGIIAAIDKIHFTTFATINFHSKSLYRPPILS